MGNWWDDRARDLQSIIREGELERRINYEDEEVSTAIVHTRQDIVLLVSNLSSISKQLRTISRFSFFILLVLILIAVNI